MMTTQKLKFTPKGMEVEPRIKKEDGEDRPEMTEEIALQRLNKIIDSYTGDD